MILGILAALYGIAGYAMFWLALVAHCPDEPVPLVISRSLLYLVLGPPILAASFALAAWAVRYERRLHDEAEAAERSVSRFADQDQLGDPVRPLVQLERHLQ